MGGSLQAEKLFADFSEEDPTVPFHPFSSGFGGKYDPAKKVHNFEKKDSDFQRLHRLRRALPS